MKTTNRIIDFIKNELNYSTHDIGPGTSLFRGGILSSLDLVSLLDFVEREFGVIVPPEDVDFENFDSPELLSQYIDKKKAV